MTNINTTLPDDLPMRDERSSPLLLHKWYQLTSPAKPPQEASFAQREAVRRGRLTSIVLLFLMITLLILLPIGLMSPNSIAIVAISGGLLISSVALLFNRLGRPNVAGLLITFYVFVAVVLVILSSPGGLSTSTLGLFYTLVFVEVLAASLLPVNWVLIAAVANIAFVIADLSLQHKVPEFAHVMSTDFYTITIRLISLHIFVVLVLWLWVRSATQALKRADNAEDLVIWERQIQELQQAKLRQKEELEKGIELILQTHIQVSNGNFQARAPLSQDNLLWRIAYSLNNLIGRMQNSSQAETELHHAREAIARLTDELQEARRMQRPVQITPTKTFLDPFLQELLVAHLPLNQAHFQAQPLAREKESTRPLNRHQHHANNRDM